MATQALQRLRQTLAHLVGVNTADDADLAIVSGVNYPPLSNDTIGGLLRRTSEKYGDRLGISCAWTGARLTYAELSTRSRSLAGGLLDLGLNRGDHIAIISGNCEQYVEATLAAAIIGTPLVVLNTNYTEQEIENTIRSTRCKLLFASASLGIRELLPTLTKLLDSSKRELALLQHVVIFRQGDRTLDQGLLRYEDLVTKGVDYPAAKLEEIERLVQPNEIASLQFTSGTSGLPKVAMLSHSGLINNAIGCGFGLRLTEQDSLCCVVPLFHCFGLVLGILMSLAYGSTLSFPCENFSPAGCLKAVTDEKLTIMYGVPTMYTAYLQEIAKQPAGTYDLSSLRVGMTGGAPTPIKLFHEMRDILKLPHIVQLFGMTECSPVTFLTPLGESFELCTTTVGRPMPHVTAKVVDPNGKTVRFGERGECLISGYGSFQGYWENPAKTAEMLARDDEGVLWLKTGDEVTINKQGYCVVSGRIKDLIIRGGENIFPAEIEDRLVQHPSVLQASVVGIKDARYGEVVGAFLHHNPKLDRPSTPELASWVNQKLARHNVPAYIWWLGDEGVGATYPQTASGKIMKNRLRDIGVKLSEQS